MTLESKTANQKTWPPGSGTAVGSSVTPPSLTTPSPGTFILSIVGAAATIQLCGKTSVHAGPVPFAAGPASAHQPIMGAGLRARSRTVESSVRKLPDESPLAADRPGKPGGTPQRSNMGAAAWQDDTGGDASLTASETGPGEPGHRKLAGAGPASAHLFCEPRGGTP